MSFHVLTWTQPGAPSLYPTDGRLVAVLDWALPQGGWTIDDSSGNARIYRSPSGRYLYVNNTTATSGGPSGALVRGCESGSSIGALVNPFPTVAQSSDTNCNWKFTNTNSVNTQTRPWKVVIIDDFFWFLASPFSEAETTWAMWGFGGVPTPYVDDYACVIGARNTSLGSGSFDSLGSLAGVASLAWGSGANNIICWQRNVDGSILSSRGTYNHSSTSAVGTLTAAPAPRGGYQNRIFRESIAFNDLGSQTASAGSLGLVKRGYAPNLWGPLHNGTGGLSSEDTFQDTAYDPAAVFRPHPSAHGSGIFILEETDTWRPY